MQLNRLNTLRTHSRSTQLQLSATRAREKNSSFNSFSRNIQKKSAASMISRPHVLLWHTGKRFWHFCVLVPEIKGQKSHWKEFIEDISVLQWVLSFLFLGVSCLLLMVYLMFTSLWPLPTLYFTWQIYDWHTPETGGRQTKFVRSWEVWRHFRDYFPVKLVKTAELSPSKNYILGCHPHGIMCVGAFTCFSTDHSGFAKTFPEVRPTLAILAGLFHLPLFREYIMCAGLTWFLCTLLVRMSCSRRWFYLRAVWADDSRHFLSRLWVLLHVSSLGDAGCSCPTEVLSPQW
ncbi:diacylglycerol O-acyltransferase 2-like isoform X4 [Myxocyprinus asiaticus]|uniref:diacylglycerol O-acyltransferase 2-like isoform X4 n=1 Tax=Myxocyprinus asiaticus TaxID=70543 RepID=UPI0022218737|nr:diacylglycerol O-acyltransferase 2-like isoform X4 [Myxocyprinus asiaticus]